MDNFTTQEYTPQQERSFYENRRRRLMELCHDGLILIPHTKSSSENFLYLTGFDEEDAVCLLIPGSDRPFRLYVTPDDPVKRLWTGKHYGTEGAKSLFGADEAYPVSELSSHLLPLSKGKKKIYAMAREENMKEFISRLAGLNMDVRDPSSFIEEMRVFKDELEVSLLRKAAVATCEGFIRSAKATRPGIMEYEIQAEMEYVYKRNGMEPGYSSIVGSGPNATVLHYERNNRRMQDGDLLLMDAAAAYRHYSADLTRTIPVNGKFTPEQKVLYELVLQAELAAIREMVPGKKILDCHHTAARVIAEGLHRLGLITDLGKYWQKRFYIHYRVDHYIGLNVHDAGSYGSFNAANREEYIINPEIRGRLLEPGMALTVEPGVYMNADRISQLREIFPDVPQQEIDEFVARVKPVYDRYAGIGIRIEDDILITPDGNENLTAGAPKTVEEIEALMVQHQ